MSPANIQGLNIVHPAPQAESQDLLAGPPFPDLSAQLDLWTNLSFDSEESPLNVRKEENANNKYSTRQHDEEEEEVRSPITGEKAIQDGHVNVVTPTNVGANSSQEISAPAFDINTFLAGFGIDPYGPVAMHSQHQPHHPTLPALPAPSIAQLLALHPPHPAPFLPQNQSIQQPQYAHVPRPAYTAPTPAARASSPTEDVPPVKRARSNTKTSTASPEAAPTGVTAAEDKRRRNTAASARFRLKKKEREAALESKAKELETKVNELERECEALRRENGWLKGLVVGVTGAAAGPVVVPQSTTPPPTISAGNKRSREDESA